MQYEEIFSNFYLKQKDPSFLKLDTTTAYSMMIEWLHETVAESHIRNIFSSITLDDEIMELTYELKRPLDLESDNDFVKDVFAQGMVICWMKPLVDNILNTSVVLGGKEQKKLQSNYAQNINRLESLERKLKKYVRDYQYLNGEY